MDSQLHQEDWWEGDVIPQGPVRGIPSICVLHMRNPRARRWGSNIIKIMERSLTEDSSVKQGFYQKTIGLKFPVFLISRESCSSSKVLNLVDSLVLNQCFSHVSILCICILFRCIKQTNKKIPSQTRLRVVISSPPPASHFSAYLKTQEFDSLRHQFLALNKRGKTLKVSFLYFLI